MKMKLFHSKMGEKNKEEESASDNSRFGNL